MKLCARCGECKPLSGFFKNKARKDGVQVYCKTCFAAIVKEHRREHPEQYRNYQRKKFMTPEQLEKKRINYLKFCRANRLKQAAWRAVHRAKMAGLLIPEPCVECGDLVTEAHHSDYSKPLNVTWLCFKHHRMAHGQLQ